MYSLGRWQENGDAAYVQVHKDALVIGSININNMFHYTYHGYDTYNYGSYFDKNIDKFHGKTFKSIMDCLDHLNGRK